MTQYIRFPTVTAAATTAVNLTQVGGVAITLGQKVSNSSVPVVLASNQPTINVAVASSTLPSGAATELTLAAINTRTAGSLVPISFNEVLLAYVVSGNGVGQVATATYLLSSTTVRTLTMSYDVSDRLSGVVAS